MRSVFRNIEIHFGNVNTCYQPTRENHSKVRSVVEMRELGPRSETGVLFATMYLKDQKRTLVIWGHINRNAPGLMRSSCEPQKIHISRSYFLNGIDSLCTCTQF